MVRREIAVILGSSCGKTDFFFDGSSREIGVFFDEKNELFLRLVTWFRFGEIKMKPCFVVRFVLMKHYDISD